MEVKNILSLAVNFLDKKELLKDEYFLQVVPEDYQLDEDFKEEINELLFCLNAVYDEIATDYMPLLHTEKVEFENGEFSYSQLEKVFLDVYLLKDDKQRRIKFKMFPEKIVAKTKVANLTYSFSPPPLTLNDSIESFLSRIPARVFAYGVAMEYCFLKSLSTDALIWENRYKNALLSLARRKTEITLPARRWI